MRIQTACLTLFTVLLNGTASAQSLQPNALQGKQVTDLSMVGAKVPVETFFNFSRIPTRNRVLANFQTDADTLRVHGTSNPFANGRFIPNRFHKGASPTLMNLSPQSQIFVIDTAIVRNLEWSSVFPPSPADTTRHVYSFNASVQRTSDLIQKLRADLWVDTLRQTNTYDANGELSSYLYEAWSDSQWVNSFRYTYTYDANGNNLSELCDTWSSGQWTNTYRYTYAYDANGNMLSHLYEEYSNGQWVNGDRGTYTYDARKNRLSYLYESWSNGQWVNRERGTFTYDTQGNMLTLLFDWWLNGQLLTSARNTYTYDAQGNMLSASYEYWSGGQWANNGRATYAYDAAGHQIFYLGEVWSNGQYANSERGTYIFDGRGNQTSYLYETWIDGQWGNSECGTFDYDASGHKLSDVHEYWQTGQWVNRERYAYTCDDQGNVTSLWHYTWLNSIWTPSNITSIFRGYGFTGTATDSAGNYYDFGLGYSYTFAHKLLGTGIVSDGGNIAGSYSLSQNYPNPFNPSTIIKYELPKSSVVRLSVFDLLGREVSVLVNEKKDVGAQEVKFDGSNLASGVYFYRLQVRPLDSAKGRDSKSGAGDFTQTKQLILVK